MQNTTQSEIMMILPETWVHHIEKQLLPFWITEQAIGINGKFPTFRYNNGSVVNVKELEAEYEELNRNEVLWITLRLNRTYTRMISRQIYLYCISYNILGTEDLLIIAKSGVEYILALQDNNGSFPSWTEQDQYYPELEQRTSQDLAYALLGLTLYYYLTRDDNILKRIILAKDYIFENYWNNSWDGLKWVKKDLNDHPDRHTSTQKELVAQLDQINAYMLLLAIILPEGEDKKRLIDDLFRVCGAVEKFYDPANNVFWGDLDKKQLNEHHVDFGHTIKAFCMLYLVEKKFHRKALQQWTQDGSLFNKITCVLKDAFIIEESTWGEKKIDATKISKHKVWWIHAELSQAVAILGLEPNYDYIVKEYFIPACNFWFSKFVDQKNHSVWHMLQEGSNEPIFPKAHLWKNGYHSFEHALIGLITSKKAYNEKIGLFFSFNKSFVLGSQSNKITPYYFDSEDYDICESESFHSSNLDTLNKQKILFTIK